MGGGLLATWGIPREVFALKNIIICTQYLETFPPAPFSVTIPVPTKCFAFATPLSNSHLQY